MNDDFTAWLQEQDREWIPVGEVHERFPEAIFLDAARLPVERGDADRTLVHRRTWRRSYVGTASRVGKSGS